MKNNQSRDQLSKSLDRRVRHLMIRVLEKFEDSFSDLETTHEGQVFKGDLRNAFNDVLRAQRDELRDYEVDYRPFRFNEDNTLAMTQAFMQAVQKVKMGFVNQKPFVEIHASVENVKILESLRAELGAGVVVLDETGRYALLQIVGVDPCINCVLPLLDRYRLHADVRAEYKVWRGEVVKLYRS